MDHKVELDDEVVVTTGIRCRARKLLCVEKPLHVKGSSSNDSDRNNLVFPMVKNKEGQQEALVSPNNDVILQSLLLGSFCFRVSLSRTGSLGTREQGTTGVLLMSS